MYGLFISASSILYNCFCPAWEVLALDMYGGPEGQFCCARTSCCCARMCLLLRTNELLLRTDVPAAAHERAAAAHGCTCCYARMYLLLRTNELLLRTDVPAARDILKYVSHHQSIGAGTFDNRVDICTCTMTKLNNLFFICMGHIVKHTYIYNFWIFRGPWPGAFSHQNRPILIPDYPLSHINVHVK